MKYENPTIYNTAEQHKQLVDDLSVANAVIQRLQEQLNEANELIKQINRNPDTDENSVNCCFFYLEKWGVK